MTSFAIYRNIPAAGDMVCGISSVRPSLIATGLESSVIVPDFRPSRLAVTVIVPGVRVERMATRLMPHSVSRKRLLVVFNLSLQNSARRARWPGR